MQHVDPVATAAAPPIPPAHMAQLKSLWGSLMKESFAFFVPVHNLNCFEEVAVHGWCRLTVGCPLHERAPVQIEPVLVPIAAPLPICLINAAVGCEDNLATSPQCARPAHSHMHTSYP